MNPNTSITKGIDKNVFGQGDKVNRTKVNLPGEKRVEMNVEKGIDGLLLVVEVKGVVVLVMVIVVEGVVSIAVV